MKRGNYISSFLFYAITDFIFQGRVLKYLHVLQTYLSKFHHAGIYLIITGMHNEGKPGELKKCYVSNNYHLLQY